MDFSFGIRERIWNGYMTHLWGVFMYVYASHTHTQRKYTISMEKRWWEWKNKYWEERKRGTDACGIDDTQKALFLPTQWPSSLYTQIAACEQSEQKKKCMKKG